MRKLVLAITLIAGSFAAKAQLDLPQPSPKATVKQTVGLTDVTIEYSSPAVKGRAIWGELVPYSELWRTGANAPTKVTFSKDVNINGKAIPAGTYTLLTIPEKENWTIMFNKDAELRSTSGYSQEKDIVSMRIKPQVISNRERFTVLVSDFTNEGGNISLEWEKLRIDIPFTVNTDHQALLNITSTLNASWRSYTNAAKYLLDNKKDSELALSHINSAISLSPNQWYSHWIKAQIHAEKKQNKEAFASAQKAKELGDKSSNFFYKNDVEKALVDWKPAKK
ncbi:MAG: DUF2911 domain-containing protein [Bacteroidetes bacterium]|nr:DUF2911 domain-containing protein [Bacteroidota bacterium]